MSDRRAFVRELSNIAFTRATPDVTRHLLALFADPGIDWQDLARPVASLLLREENEELLHAYLRKCVNTSWELERRLLRFECGGTAAAFESGSPAAALQNEKLRASLAIQNFLNGFLWHEPDDELPDDAGAQRMLADEPAEERRLAATLRDEVAPDAVTSAVRAQYEVHPYPRWLSLYRPEPESGGTPRRALVAGCGTGREVIALALRHPTWHIDAVDISRRSLGYAMRKAREYGAANIAFRLADLRRVEGEYDVIHAVGVLHHLADPVEGLRALRRCLAPDGEMTIGVYSRRARASLARFRELGGDAEPRLARARIFAALDGKERAELEDLDFFELGHFIDLLYHAHETEVTPLELEAMLETAGLRAGEDLRELEARELANPDLFRNMIRCRVTIAR